MVLALCPQSVAEQGGGKKEKGEGGAREEKTDEGGRRVGRRRRACTRTHTQAHSLVPVCPLLLSLMCTWIRVCRYPLTIRDPSQFIHPQAHTLRTHRLTRSLLLMHIQEEAHTVVCTLLTTPSHTLAQPRTFAHMHAEHAHTHRAHPHSLSHAHTHFHTCTCAHSHTVTPPWAAGTSLLCPRSGQRRRCTPSLST